MKIREKMESVKVGDTVTRMLGGIIPMQLKVTEIKEDRIVAGLGYEFLLETGAEIDEDLGWDGITKTGAFLKFD